jgi:hypothetical protein
MLIVPLAASFVLAVGSFWLASRPSDDGNPGAGAPSANDSRQTQTPSDSRATSVDRPIAAVGSHDEPSGTN